MGATVGSGSGDAEGGRLGSAEEGAPPPALGGEKLVGENGGDPGILMLNPADSGDGKSNLQRTVQSVSGICKQMPGSTRFWMTELRQKTERRLLFHGTMFHLPESYETTTRKQHHHTTKWQMFFP